MSNAFGSLKTALSGRYTIEGELGSGGMATVYLAHDLKHDRKVAVKVFRPELAAALGSERFFREIKITANLNHPHILPLLDSGKTEGEAREFLYYVMPLVEGESLRDRLNREKQLAVDEALTITSQVASALSYAHSRDIVHRDIKPENILFQAGEVVVADFGIALAVDSAGGTRLTETGFSLGTPAYMSPEQVSGEQVLDGRSDIYSLACVLYEMLAGDPPFVASSPRAVLAKHITDPAPPITTVRSSVPLAVADALTKALGKAPADRFDSAKTFSAALYATGVDVEAGKKSIVVLPFENLSADPGNEYFCDGLTEAIINTFTALKDLKVVARTSAFSFKGKNADVRDIGRRLDVNNVLEGSVQRAGNRLRITAQLVDVSNGYHLWSQRFDRTMDDIFAIQDEISLAIAENLQIELLEGDKGKLVKRHTNDPDAYNLYLKGRYFYRKRTAEGLNKGIENFELAIQKDSGFALPYAGLADTYLALGFYDMLPWSEAWDKAKQMALKAVEVDDSVCEAHMSLAMLYAWVEYDQKRGEREFLRALELNPAHAEAHHFYSHYLAALGSFERALSEMNKAIKLEPLSVDLQCCLGQLLYDARRSDDAIRQLQEAIEIDPSFALSYWALGKAYVQNGMLDRAIEVLEKAAALPSIRIMARSVLGYAYAVTGATDMARAVLDELSDLSRTRPVDHYFMAIVYAGLGEAENAIDELYEAYDARSMHLAQVGAEFLFAALREHPRMVILLKKMGLRG